MRLASSAWLALVLSVLAGAASAEQVDNSGRARDASGPAMKEMHEAMTSMAIAMMQRNLQGIQQVMQQAFQPSRDEDDPEEE